MGYYKPSAFTATGAELPDRSRPREWIVWHFTHSSNLPGILSAGNILPDAVSKPNVNVGLNNIKALRRKILVRPDAEYPKNKSVADHVPFYIAARSPMLFTVTRGHADYNGGTSPLIFLGVPIGKIADSGLVWCASNANAATGMVSFSRDLNSLGSFVDFDLLCQRDWKNTEEDPHRASRRAAEVLVLNKFPIKMITHVIARNQQTIENATQLFAHVPGSRQYRLEPGFYYD